MHAKNRPADPFGLNGRIIHVHLSVRSALRDFSKRQLKGMFAWSAVECAPRTKRKTICSRHWPKARKLCRSGLPARASTSRIPVAPAMEWIYNSLVGPGQLPPESETDTQAHLNREIVAVNTGMEEALAFHEAQRAAK